MKEFLSIISGLDLSDAKKVRISLENINLGALATLVQSSSGPGLIRQLADPNVRSTKPPQSR
jgi:hypothetical protein